MFIFLILLTFSYTFSAQTTPNFCRITEPPNISVTRRQIIDYFSSGSYNKEIECIAAQGRAHLESIKNAGPEYAVIFDIDETIISNWEHNNKQQFVYHKDLLRAWEETAGAPAIRPMQELYRYILERGFTIILITGRGPHTKEYTTKNLLNTGYCSWKAIVFRPADYHGPNAFYKTEARRLIEERGYTIVANFGDQESDLAGGYAQKTFKLPNPMYWLP